MKVGVLSFGVGNFMALMRMYQAIGVDADLVTCPAELELFDRLTLPGVGHFGYAMHLLQRGGWDAEIRRFALELERPILGVCLGAQLMGVSSEEGGAEGLGVMPFSTSRIRASLPVPSMGWRSVTYSSSHFSDSGIAPQSRYFFSHSYEMVAEDTKDVIGTYEYDGPRTAVVCRGKLIAAQFHPEKSHQFGKQFLKWFSKL